MNAEIVTIGIVKLDDGEREMRFRRDPGIEGKLAQWVPDLIVDHKMKTTKPPPDCFKPKVEIIEMLEAAYAAAIEPPKKRSYCVACGAETFGGRRWCSNACLRAEDGPQWGDDDYEED